MKTVKVLGKNKKHEVLMYALSTCAWCKMTKKFLKDLEVEYEYIDVDLCSQEERDAIRKEITNRGGELAYPVIIVDQKTLINGLLKDRIKEALEL